MARKIYKRIGIRRDRNLADLSDTKQGLNSLLDTLIDETGNTFISEDLDVTRNLFAEGMTSDQYQKFIGSRTQKTNTNGTLTDLLPPVTYQNKLDKFQFFLQSVENVYIGLEAMITLQFFKIQGKLLILGGNLPPC